MSLLKVSKFLYRTRALFAAAALLFILYSGVFLWFHVPFGSPVFRWRSDSRPVITAVPDELSALLSPGDVVEQIGGRSVVRGRPFYPLPLATTYEFVLLREGDRLTVSVPVYAPLNMTVVSMLLPPTLLSLSGWFLGAMMLFWARRDNSQALYTGYIFLLAGAVLMGVQASLDGVPGAWLVHTLIFPLLIGWLYLGTVPRAGSLPVGVRKLLLALFLVTCALAVAMAYEVVFLFPRFTSFQHRVGVGLYELGFLLSSLALLSCVGLLLWRVWRLPRDSYIRQQLLILLVFFAVGVFPAVLLTIMPRALFDIVLLPFPVAITLMTFIPAGYLFVIYRKGLLGLDPFFSRMLYLVLMSLVVFGFYTSGLYLVQYWLRLDGASAVAPATIIFFPTLLLTLSVNKPLNEFVQWLVYGDEQLYDGALAQITHAFSTRPELRTLESVIDLLLKTVDVSQAMLVFWQEKTPMLVRVIGIEASPQGNEWLMEVRQPVVRSVMPATKVAQAFNGYEWAEMLLPVVVRDEQVGLLALACPGQDGYFNNRQVAFLTQVAGILGVGSDNITLFETTRLLSRQSLAVREQERKNLAGRIHDEAVQEIASDGYALEALAADLFTTPPAEIASRVKVVSAHLHHVAKTLRMICAGLYPPFWGEGVEIAVTEIVDMFRLRKKLTISLEIKKEQETLPRVVDVATESTGHILTECLNNIVKHGRGTAVQVELEHTSQTISLTVTDWGPGSDFVYLPYSDLVRGSHFGIVGMHDRAQLANGSLRIKANEPSGLKVMFTCPTV
jgi:signal transduction histidine kinase